MQQQSKKSNISDLVSYLGELDYLQVSKGETIPFDKRRLGYLRYSYEGISGYTAYVCFLEQKNNSRQNPKIKAFLEITNEKNEPVMKREFPSKQAETMLPILKAYSLFFKNICKERQKYMELEEKKGIHYYWRDNERKKKIPFKILFYTEAMDSDTLLIVVNWETSRRRSLEKSK